MVHLTEVEIVMYSVHLSAFFLFFNEMYSSVPIVLFKTDVIQTVNYKYLSKKRITFSKENACELLFRFFACIHHGD